MPWDFSDEPSEGDYLEFDGDTATLLDEDDYSELDGDMVALLDEDDLKDNWEITTESGSTWGDIEDYGPISEGEKGNFAADDSFSMQSELGDYLTYDGYTVQLFDKDGFLKDSWEATSGMPGSTFKDQGINDYGPIPEGDYDFDPGEIEHFEWYNPLSWGSPFPDWGKGRVEVFRTPETIEKQLSKKIDRKGLFFHGGRKPGSKGCIDLGYREEDFFKRISKYKGKMRLKVYYDP
ncbi:MAG: hypothetical protein HZA78_10635 [Candidatus Schekmanbacteria bacterium]|nr:hypothetical protein [Candidatus Schekmanbacteria bacterium]